MTNSELSIEVANTTNQKVMRLYDTSYYYKDEIVQNYIIEVLPVNKSVWVTFNVTKGFSLVLNASNLRYKKVSEETDLIDLPDGIYEIKQSYKPNTSTLHHFYYLRVTQFSNKLESERNKLYGNMCNLDRREFILHRDKLRDIEEYIKAAKWMVEECCDREKGKELYEFSNTLLEKYSNECQC